MFDKNKLYRITKCAKTNYIGLILNGSDINISKEFIEIYNSDSKIVVRFAKNVIEFEEFIDDTAEKIEISNIIEMMDYVNIIEKMRLKRFNNLTREQLEIVHKWKTDIYKLRNMILKDIAIFIKNVR